MGRRRGWDCDETNGDNECVAVMESARDEFGASRPARDATRWRAKGKNGGTVSLQNL
jgi:hypothetical protein